MDKIRIIGLLLLIVGIFSQLMIENDLTDFISGVLIGAGLGLLLIGGKSKPKNN